MLIIGKIENKAVILLLTFLFIILIGFLDYISGPELSFSLFYFIPIAFISTYRGTTLISVILCSVFASMLWFLAEYISREYSLLFFPIWNALVRLCIFATIGILILYLKKKHKKLEEKNKFLGIAAHDMRSPVGTIYSFTDLLINHHAEHVKPEILKILNIIRSTSSNTLLMLNNLLNISKFESGKIELKLKNIDYIEFIRQQIHLYELKAKYKNIAISFQSTVDKVMADFDVQYLTEVIDNLMSNAIKYSNNGSEIKVSISTSENKYILTEVSDKGSGIPKEEQQKLFNYFQTTSIRPTQGEPSTGLGLAIAKQIVTLHKGDIGVKSEPNQGSTFYFTLPIKNTVK